MENSVVALHLLSSESCCPSQTTDQGATAILYACKNKMKDVVSILLTMDCNSGSMEFKYKMESTLTLASRNNWTDIAVKILELKTCNPGHIDWCKETPLTRACRNKSNVLVHALLATDDCNVGHVCEYGKTALMIACENGMVSVHILWWK